MNGLLFRRLDNQLCEFMEDRILSDSPGVRTAIIIAVVLMAAGCKQASTPKGDPQRGFAILAATPDSLPNNVGNGLRCFSCHLDNGHKPNGMPITASYTQYPSFSKRSGGTMSIYARVNNCLTRSLAGRGLASDSREMTDIVAYLASIAHGLPRNSHVAGEGLVKLPRLIGDTARGGVVFAARCARCHGASGQGIPPATPLWGARSFAIGASLSWIDRAASFIRYNMPFDSAGVLSDQQAYDVAAYILSHPRQDTRGKEHDFPAGDAPWDVPYNTPGHVAYNPPPLLPPAFH
jgi:thiosulfate dehydrogenase